MPSVTLLALFASALLAQNVYNGRPPLAQPDPDIRRPGSINVDGIWQTRLIMPDKQVRLIKMRFRQDGIQVTASAEGNNADRDGIVAFRGRFVDAVTIDGQSPGPQATPQNLRLEPEKVLIDDPDHIRFTKGPVLFWRVTARADDVPCDAKNTYHVKPDYAFLRGRSAIAEQKDYAKGACWLRIAADQGNARSQSLLAFLLYDGRGVTADYPQSFALAQKSAAQGDIFGEMVLSELYKTGKGVTANPQQSAYWTGRARAQKSESMWQGFLNNKTPSGLTGLEVLRMALPSPEESELAQYQQDDHNCRTYQNHDACINAANLKADLASKGIDVNKP